MKQNTCDYSDNWQPYIGDYDKFEYDVKLKDGTMVENCYPNGGKFNSISDEHNQQDFDENEVAEIRFSQKPRFGINSGVSEVPQYEWLDKQIELRKQKEQFEAPPIPYINPYTKLQEVVLASLHGKTKEEKLQTRIQNIEESIEKHIKETDSSWTREYELIRNKQSKLSKREREYLVTKLNK
jgi:hypothetical protein